MDVWKDSMKFCEQIYELTNRGQLSEDYGLRDQLRRSAISIPSNLAEGFERDNDNEFVQFLRVAKGSAGELRTQLDLANRIGYLSEEISGNLFNRIENISKQIYGLMEYIREKES